MKIGREHAASGWRWAGATQYLLLAGVVLLASIATFHPYFFGDEVGALHVAAFERLDFSQTFQDLNSYKPRVIFNAAWAAFGSAGVLRATVMASFALGMFACGAAVFAVAKRVPGSSPWLCWLAALVLVTSRFGAMLYYDYLSGTIEVWALALFLGGLLCLFDQGGLGASKSRRLLGLLLLTACVFVHERYVAALAVVGAFVCLDGYRMLAHDRRGGATSILLGLTIAVIPLLLFVLATRWLSVASVLVGTAGRKVEFSTEILQCIATYLSNVLLGTNFGRPWFVGVLNQDAKLAWPLFGMFAAVFLVAWLLPWWRRRWVAPDRLWTPLLGLTALGLIVVASLPGVELQQARWMFPVLALLIMLIVITYRAYARIALLGLLLCNSLAYLVFGGYSQLASIKASRAAPELAALLNAAPAGSRGFIVDDVDTRWVISGGPYINNDGQSGTVFCSLNITSGACMDPVSRAVAKDLDDYDFAVQSMPPAAHGRPQYKVVSADSARMMLDPQTIPADVGYYVARGSQWKDWRWSAQPATSDQGIALMPGVDGFVEVDMADLAGKLIVYRAKSIDGGKVPMRLQVNWQSGPASVGASIGVVEAGAQTQNFAQLLTPPAGAKTGLVYASLHGDTGKGVILESIRLVDTGTSSSGE